MLYIRRNLDDGNMTIGCGVCIQVIAIKLFNIHLIKYFKEKFI